MKRVALAMLAALVILTPAHLNAQDTTVARKPAADSLAARGAPAAVPGLEAALTPVAQRRAQVARILLLTNDAVNDQQNQLRQLDAELLQAQLTLEAQRNQFRALNAALATPGGGAVLVVLFRADSARPSAPSELALSIDGANTTTRSFDDAATAALRAGAADEIFRGVLLPTAHEIVVSATVGGKPLRQSLRISTASGAVTYVEFSVRNGAVVQSNWAARAPGTN